MKSDFNETIVLKVPINKIRQLENSRINYDETSMLEMMSSLKTRGLMQPIRVAKLPRGEWQVIFGNRRFIAAKKLGWPSIEAIEVALDDDKPTQDMIFQNAAENMVREDVPLTEQGRTFLNLRKDGMTPSEIAVRVGCTKSRVLKALDAFNHVPKKFQDHIGGGRDSGSSSKDKKGKISGSVALLATSVSRKCRLNAEKTDMLFQYAQQDGVSGDMIRLVGGLLRQGLSLEEAIVKTDRTRMVWLGFGVDREWEAKVCADSKLTLHEYILNCLITAGVPIVTSARQSPSDKVKTEVSMEGLPRLHGGHGAKESGMRKDWSEPFEELKS